MARLSRRDQELVRRFRDAARGEGDHALLDGWHLLHEVAASELALESVAVSGEPPSAADASLLDRLAHRPGATITAVSAAVMHMLSPVRTPSGVVALVRPPRVEWRQLLSPAPPLIVLAIDLQDPGNAGAVVRASEAGGATGVILAGASADAWGWKALRAAMGSTFRLPVLRERDPLGACATLTRHGVALVAAVPGRGRPMHDEDLRGPTALLLGGEGGGLAAPVVEAADRLVTIPMAAPVESLNVAVAAGVLVYEARRQRLAR